MRRIVLDIETCAFPFESLSESQQEYLLRYAEKETDPGKKQEQTDQAIRYTRKRCVPWAFKTCKSTNQHLRPINNLTLQGDHP